MLREAVDSESKTSPKKHQVSIFSSRRELLETCMSTDYKVYLGARGLGLCPDNVLRPKSDTALHVVILAFGARRRRRLLRNLYCPTTILPPFSSL
jgi:hypothetical protein